MSDSVNPRQLRMADYTYNLPDDRIALYPLPQRDAAKLLVYKNGEIKEDTFRYIANHIPEGSLLVLNDAKVVRARMIFQKPTGGIIEIFCLEPHPMYRDVTTAMNQTREVLWQCLVGGAAKWKDGISLAIEKGNIRLQAEVDSKNQGEFTILFSWSPSELSFAEILETFGEIPLPPYINRGAEDNDNTRYQTVFAENEGSVAAPTASLHFTSDVFKSLTQKGIDTTHLTLHVGAGTFMPVKTENAGDHHMHHEWIEVNEATVSRLLSQPEKPVIAGGTTALRTLESLFWIGCKILKSPQIEPENLAVTQWEPYDAPSSHSKEASLLALLKWMQQKGLKKLITRTGILIAPGYQFKMADALITNFHQPNSTLLLLIAAFAGNDWKRIYDFALSNDFRFLSYGDGSLLWRNQT